MIPEQNTNTKTEKETEKKPESKTEKPSIRVVSKTTVGTAGATGVVGASGVPGTSGPSEVKGKLALILIRGLIGIRRDIKTALFSLRLRKKHACTVIEDTPSNRAITMKCKDYIAYGEIEDDTLKLLLEKRGRKNPKKKGFLKKFFLLHPPRGGFERKGIKTPFKKGGALGYRGTNINDLIKKML